jgi:hypothetical protein
MGISVIHRITQFLGTKSLINFASVNKSIRTEICSAGPEFWKDRWIFYMEPCDTNIRNTYEGFLKLCGMWRSIKQRISSDPVYRVEEPCTYVVVSMPNYGMLGLLLPFTKRDFRTFRVMGTYNSSAQLIVEHVARVHFKTISPYIRHKHQISDVCGNDKASRNSAKAGTHILPQYARSIIVENIICEPLVCRQQTIPDRVYGIMRFTLCGYSLDAVKEYWFKACSTADKLSSVHSLGSKEWCDALRILIYEDGLAC